jgi:hypothetical protein
MHQVILMPLVCKFYKTSPPLNVNIIPDTVKHAGFFFKHTIPETRSGVKRWKLPHLKSVSRLLEQCLTLTTRAVSDADHFSQLQQRRNFPSLYLKKGTDLVSETMCLKILNDTKQCV